MKQMGAESPPSEGDPAEALIGGMGAMIAQFAGTGIEVGQAAYTGLGLDSIDGVGASTKDLGGGLKRNRTEAEVSERSLGTLRQFSERF